MTALSEAAPLTVDGVENTAAVEDGARVGDRTAGRAIVEEMETNADAGR